MDDLSAKRLEVELHGAVSLLRAIADRLATLATTEAHEPLRLLRAPLTSLAQAAAPVLGPLPSAGATTSTDRAAWPTVVFVRRGSDLEA